MSAIAQRPLNQAVLAATMICPRIIHAVALAGHGPREESLNRIREAQKHTRELLTRLEVSELELAAQGRAA